MNTVRKYVNNLIRQLTRFSPLLLTVIMLFTSCWHNSKQENRDDTLLKIDIDTTTVLFRYKTTLFTLPSPHQATIFIKKNNFSFNHEFINPEKNFSKYSTTIKKALNLGVYGTDLGYLNIYEKNQEAITYFLIIEKLAKELEISNALDENTLKNIEKNLSSNDSILKIISTTYQNIDSYLSENNRDAVSALIIVGSWIESLYIITQSLIEKDKPGLVVLIGKQKYPLDKLISMLAPYYNQSNEFSELIDMFTDLAYEYDCMDIDYKYKPPTVYPKDKLTVVNSESELLLNNYNIKKIVEKVAATRSKIINL